MSESETLYRKRARSGSASRASFSRAEKRGPIIDQEGREVRPEQLGSDGGAFSVGVGGVPLFGDLTREQRLARLEAIAKLLDIAFVLPGTKIRYGVDGIVGLIPVVGDVIATALSLWLVREARALGAPWHLITRMLGNVAVQGVAGTVPFAGDAFDVLFRANMRNARLLRRWLNNQS